MNESDTQNRKVGWLLGIGIFFLPPLAWLTARSGYSTLARVLSFGWLGVFIVTLAADPPSFEDTPEEIAAREVWAAEKEREEEAERAAELAEKESGLHCLSEWDGASRPFKNAIMDAMRDPGSFEHIETRITKRNPEGEHGLVMEFRARNGFGGMNIATAIGAVDSETCEVTRVNEFLEG